MSIENCKKHMRKHAVELCFVLAIVVMMVAMNLNVNVYATSEYWAVTSGERDIAVLKTEEDAQEVIDELREEYVQDGAEDVLVRMDPELSVERRFYSSGEEPELDTVDEAKEAVATAKNKKGEQLVKIRVTQTVTQTEEIAFTTEYEEDSTMAAGTEETKQAGENGEKQTVTKITTVNGVGTSKEVLSEKTTKEPVTQIIVKGTKQEETQTSGSSASSAVSASGSTSSGSTAASSSSTGSVTGQAVVNYALQFVGNPYVYGGTSLTNGCDCSGFTLAVYAHFGISLPHGALSQLNYGTAVSSPAPGDLVVYAKGHVGIYIGNGRIVHASNPRTGIIVSSISYSGTPCGYRRLV